MFLVDFFHTLKKHIVLWYKNKFTVEGLDSCILPDKVYLKKLFKIRTGKELNLNNPRTFSEKCNWLKIYDRRPEYTVMVDKYKAREYIAERIGEQNLVPLLGAWDSPDEIDFDALPNEFVLKCNHDNGVIICRDKSTLNIEKVKKELAFRLSRDYYKKLREWPYKNVPRKIICERYMYPRENESPVDYKLMCFNGKVRLIALYAERFTGALKEDYYTPEWKYVRVIDRPCAGDVYKRPACLEEMILIAEKLSIGIPVLRVDFNIWQDMIAVGEMTFFHHGSMLPFLDEWEKITGDWIELPEKTGDNYVTTKMDNYS